MWLNAFQSIQQFYHFVEMQRLSTDQGISPNPGYRSAQNSVICTVDLLDFPDLYLGFAFGNRLGRPRQAEAGGGRGRPGEAGGARGEAGGGRGRQEEPG